MLASRFSGYRRSAMIYQRGNFLRSGHQRGFLGPAVTFLGSIASSVIERVPFLNKYAQQTERIGQVMGPAANTVTSVLQNHQNTAVEEKKINALIHENDKKAALELAKWKQEVNQIVSSNKLIDSGRDDTMRMPSCRTFGHNIDDDWTLYPYGETINFDQNHGPFEMELKSLILTIESKLQRKMAHYQKYGWDVEEPMTALRFQYMTDNFADSQYVGIAYTGHLYLKPFYQYCGNGTLRLAGISVKPRIKSSCNVAKIDDFSEWQTREEAEQCTTETGSQSRTMDKKYVVKTKPALTAEQRRELKRDLLNQLHFPVPDDAHLE